MANKKDTSRNFSDIELGDTFVATKDDYTNEHGCGLFMKVSAFDCSENIMVRAYNAVNLQNGLIECFELMEKVLPVKTVLKLSDNQE